MTLRVISPFDGTLIRELPMHSETDVATMLNEAHRIFLDRSAWLPKSKRIDILENLIALMTNHRDELAATAIAEGGKPLRDTLVEVDRAIQGVKIAIATLCAGNIQGEEIPMQLTEASLHRLAYTFREPIGVVLAISAFNHPINLIIHQVVPAIAMGCPVLLKPSSKTPLSALKIVAFLRQAGLPDGWCQTLICPSTYVEKILSDSRVRFLTFIGSSKVGWHLRQKLSPGASGTFEHGGAAPVIVEPDTILSSVVPLLVKGGFYHAGQVCVSVQRVYVHRSIAKALVTELKIATEKLRVGTPFALEVDVGPLIDSLEVMRVEQWVKEAVQEGAQLICGGKKISETLYPPTLLLNPATHSKVSQQEIFGPVICVYEYDHYEEAIIQANALPFNFQAAIFTKNLEIAFDSVRKLKANTVLINDHTAFRVDWMPFGGSEESGLGTGGIPYTMREMTREKLWILRSDVL